MAGESGVHLYGRRYQRIYGPLTSIRRHKNETIAVYVICHVMREATPRMHNDREMKIPEHHGGPSYSGERNLRIVAQKVRVVTWSNLVLGGQENRMRIKNSALT